MNISKTDIVEWRPREKGGPITFNDSCITFMPEEEVGDTPHWKSIRKVRVLAATPLSRAITKHSFMVSSPSPNPKFDVGITTSKKSVVYEVETGTISIDKHGGYWDYESERFWNQYTKKKKVIAKVEKCGINDIVECTVMYRNRAAAIHFLKNGSLISKQALQTSGVVWPVIAIGSSQTIVNINPTPTPVEEVLQDRSGSMVVEFSVQQNTVIYMYMFISMQIIDSFSHSIRR